MQENVGSPPPLNLEELTFSEVLAAFRRQREATAAALALAELNPVRRGSNKLPAYQEKVTQLTGHLAAAYLAKAEQDVELDRANDRLEHVMRDWSALEAQNEAFKERIQSLEAHVETRAREQQEAVRAGGELKAQMEALEKELVFFRKREAIRKEDHAFNLTSLFDEILKTWRHPDLTHAKMLVARSCISQRPNTDETGLAVKEALMAVLREWHAEMKETIDGIDEFKSELVADLDARTTDIKRHKAALAELKGQDLLNWGEVELGRSTITGVMDEVVRHAKMTRQAAYTAYIALEKQSKVHVLESALYLAYKLREHTDHLNICLRTFYYYDVDGNLSRTFYAVQDAIKALVAAGKRYAVSDEDDSGSGDSGAVNHGGATSSASRHFEMPETATPSYSAFDDNYHSYGSSALHDYSHNDFMVNPANGLPMVGGIGGIDVHGNPFNTDFL